jgi:hypothetical protein
MGHVLLNSGPAGSCSHVIYKVATFMGKPGIVRETKIHQGKVRD